MSNEYEEMLLSFHLISSFPMDCGPTYEVTGKDLFPYRYMKPNGELGDIRIGYRCPHCGEIIQCAVSDDLAIYLTSKKTVLCI